MSSVSATWLAARIWHCGGASARLFRYRRQQAWPPALVVVEGWDTIYLEAAEGLDVLPDVLETVSWANGFITRVTGAAV